MCLCVCVHLLVLLYVCLSISLALSVSLILICVLFFPPFKFISGLHEGFMIDACALWRKMVGAKRDVSVLRGQGQAVPK